MANIKSAKKRMRQAEKRRIHNSYYRTTARTYIKKARKLIQGGEFDQAEAVIHDAQKVLDKAAQKNIIHKNNAARRKSRLMRMLNKARSEAQAS